MSALRLVLLFALALSVAGCHMAHHHVPPGHAKKGFIPPGQAKKMHWH